MENQYFENKTFFRFLKSEFKTRKNSSGFLRNVASFFELFLAGVFNFKTQKNWNKQYQIIEKSVVNFYPELNCEINGETASFSKLLKNYGTERIGFEFNKTHLAITSDTMFFFPYTEPYSSDFGQSYNTLEESFRLVFDSKKLNKKYQENKNLKFISLENVREKTKLTVKVAELENETELVFDKKITVANTVYN